MADVNEVMSEVMVDNTVETIARMNLKQRDLFAKVLAEKWPALANKLSINIETNLIEKELDGGTIDLIEKRNLKLPIQNFLSNPFIKDELQL